MLGVLGMVLCMVLWFEEVFELEVFVFGVWWLEGVELEWMILVCCWVLEIMEDGFFWIRSGLV